MIINDKKTVQDTLDEFLDKKKNYIAADREDIRILFGDKPGLRMVRVAADTAGDLVPLLKQDLASIGGVPDKCFACYVSRDLKISDMQLLGGITEPASQIRRTIVFEKSPLGAVVLYLFFG